MKKSLTDFRYLDILGAAAIGRRLALVPEALEFLVPKATFPKKTSKYSPLEKAVFFDAEMERALQYLEKPLVTSQRVITGVIKRSGRLLNNERLHREAQKRIEEDPIYYPVRLRNLGFLYVLSNELLDGICTVREVPQLDQLTPEASQTEMKVVKSRAA
jgi:hypothetical protein